MAAGPAGTVGILSGQTIVGVNVPVVASRRYKITGNGQVAKTGTAGIVFGSIVLTGSWALDLPASFYVGYQTSLAVGQTLLATGVATATATNTGNGTAALSYTGSTPGLNAPANGSQIIVEDGGTA